MMKSFLLKITLIPAFVFLLESCASVPLASEDEDVAAKKFQPTPGKATLYVYRNSLFGAAFPLATHLNGREIGKLKVGQFQKVIVPPGSYEFQPLFQSHGEPRQLDLQAGTVTYLRTGPAMGLIKSNSRSTVIPAEKGRADLAQSRLTSHAQNPLGQGLISGTRIAQTQQAEAERERIAAVEASRIESGDAPDDEPRRVRSSTGAGKWIAGIAALGAAYGIADAGDLDGASSFLNNAVGGITTGEMPSALTSQAGSRRLAEANGASSEFTDKNDQASSDTVQKAELKKAPSNKKGPHGITIVWQDDRGRWYGHGPNQYLSSNYKDKARAIEGASGGGQKTSYLGSTNLQTRRHGVRSVEVYKVDRWVHADRYVKSSWNSNIRFVYPSLKRF